MDKAILQEYIDAYELVKDIEAEIQKLNRKKKTVIQTNVKGSMHGFPYVGQHFKVQGTAFTVKDDSHLRYEEKLLEQQRAKAEQVKQQVEEWMLTIPSRMQRIIRYRYLEGMPWEKAAAKIGRKTTGESVRKELERFLKEAQCELCEKCACYSSDNWHMAPDRGLLFARHRYLQVVNQGSF